jgi:hypothetical protein
MRRIKWRGEVAGGTVSTSQPERHMNKVAVYVFNNAQCMEFGFTMLSRYFESMEEAAAYAGNFNFIWRNALG